jgi:hypothetical protein
MWCSPLVAATIVLAGESGVATLPAPVRIDVGLVSGLAGSTANMRVFKGIPFAAALTGYRRRVDSVPCCRRGARFIWPVRRRGVVCAGRINGQN